MKRIIALLILFASCSRDEGSLAPISAEKFESLYIELLDSSAVATQAPSDSSLSPAAERILNRHNVSLEQFRATVSAYNSEPERWKEFYENVIRAYEKRSKREAE